MRTLNYSMEFIDDRNYASLRFMDLFGSLLDLQPQIKDITEVDFYERLRVKFKERQLMSDKEARSKHQKELLKMFLDEWRNRGSKA